MPSWFAFYRPASRFEYEKRGWWPTNKLWQVADLQRSEKSKFGYAENKLFELI
jgi:hypothetical protein